MTGLTARDVSRGRDFFEVQGEVATLIRNRTLIGHALHNDLAALMLSHPKALVRDTSQYVPLRTADRARAAAGATDAADRKPAKPFLKSRPRALRKLALEQLGLEIQTGAHDPAEDAVASLLLYRRHARAWEAALRVGGAAGRAAVIKGARVKRRAQTPEQRARRDAAKQREMHGRAEASAAAAASAVASSAGSLGAGSGAAAAALVAKHARVEAALPAPRAVVRGRSTRPAFLH